MSTGVHVQSPRLPCVLDKGGCAAVAGLFSQGCQVPDDAVQTPAEMLAQLRSPLPHCSKLSLNICQPPLQDDSQRLRVLLICANLQTRTPYSLFMLPDTLWVLMV